MKDKNCIGDENCIKDKRKDSREGAHKFFRYFIALCVLAVFLIPCFSLHAAASEIETTQSETAQENGDSSSKSH